MIYSLTHSFIQPKVGEQLHFARHLLGLLWTGRPSRLGTGSFSLARGSTARGRNRASALELCVEQTHRHRGDQKRVEGIKYVVTGD